jgi:holliday junction DNA helicase RuvA
MIAFLQGRVSDKTNRGVILLVGQVGYLVFLTPNYLEQVSVGKELELFIHTHVKEDALDLYGFKNTEETEFFQQLISVSGVGPKSAINIMGLASLGGLKKAITSGDPSILQQVSGIGKKTAERLVVELKEKIINNLSDQIDLGSEDTQVVEALVSLGYKERDVKELIKNLKLDGDLATRVRTALQSVNQ